MSLYVTDQDTKWDSFMNNFCSSFINAFPKKQMKTYKVPPDLFYAYTLGDVVSTSEWSHLRSTDTEQAKGVITRGSCPQQVVHYFNVHEASYGTGLLYKVICVKQNIKRKLHLSLIIVTPSYRYTNIYTEQFRIYTWIYTKFKVHKSISAWYKLMDKASIIWSDEVTTCKLLTRCITAMTKRNNTGLLSLFGNQPYYCILGMHLKKIYSCHFSKIDTNYKYTNRNAGPGAHF